MAFRGRLNKVVACLVVPVVRWCLHDSLPSMAFHFAKFRRCLYHMVKEHLNPARPHHFGLLQAVYLLLFVYYFKMLLVAWLLYAKFPPYSKPLVRYDVVIALWCYYSARFDAFIAVLAWVLILCGCLMLYIMWKVDVSRPTWRWWHELVVLNQDDYYHCKLEATVQEALIEQRAKQYDTRLKSTRIGRLFATTKLTYSALKMIAALAVFLNFENIDQNRLWAMPLPAMPHLSASIRRKLLLGMVLFDSFAYGQQIVMIVLYFGFIIANFLKYPNWATHPWPAILWFAVEFAIISNGFLLMFHYMYFFMGANIFGSFVTTAHTIKYQQAMERVLNGALKVMPTNRKLFINHVLSEHNRVSYLVLTGSEQLFGKAMYTFVMTNIPINVYLMSRIMFQRQQPLDTALFWLICFIQLAVCFVIFASQSWCCAVYHRLKRLIPKLQLMMRGATWRLTKLKYDNLYGRLLSGPKIAFCVGSISSITYLSSLEFLFTYIAYLLKTFSYLMPAKEYVESDD